MATHLLLTGATGQVGQYLLRDLLLKNQPVAVLIRARGKESARDRLEQILTRWEGILDVPLGRLQPGDAMVAHICMVFTLRDGKIVRQVNYDCYEEFV